MFQNLWNPFCICHLLCASPWAAKTLMVQPRKRQFEIFSMSFTILKKSMTTALINYHHCASSSSSSWSSRDPGEINQPLPLAASGRMLRTPPLPLSQSLELLCFKLLPPKLPKLRTSHQSAGASEGKGVGFRVDIPHKNRGCKSISFTWIPEG